MILKAKFVSYKLRKKVINLLFTVKKEGLTDDQELSMDQFLGTEGHLLFSGDKIKLAVEEKMKNRSVGIDEKGKSMSVILRGKIYKYWNEFYKGSLSDDDYYKLVMTNLINKMEQKYQDSLLGSLKEPGR